MRTMAVRIQLVQDSMFTGLVQAIGTLAALERRGGGARIAVRHEPWTDSLAVGESVAVQGICLTVVHAGKNAFECDILRETLDRTSLGSKRIGAVLNLERALRSSDRLGGHFVTGHVDGVGKVDSVQDVSGDWLVKIACAPELTEILCLKGSVACDGVSLTVAGLGASSFSVCLIPLTRSTTSLGTLAKGDAVNIETDIIGKHVHRLMGGRLNGGVTRDTLRNAGFAV